MKFRAGVTGPGLPFKERPIMCPFKEGALVVYEDGLTLLFATVAKLRGPCQCRRFVVAGKMHYHCTLAPIYMRFHRRTKRPEPVVLEAITVAFDGKTMVGLARTGEITEIRVRPITVEEYHETYLRTAGDPIIPARNDSGPSGCW